MHDLTLIKHGEGFFADSREVADMVDKDHKDLLRDIRNYIDLMRNNGERKIAPSSDDAESTEVSGGLKIQPSDFFIESTYQSEQNKTLPCFLISKKGCEFVANKLTGEKGVIFTAAYVTKFNAMESGPSYAALSPQLQLLIQIEMNQTQQARQLEATNKRIDNISEIVALNPMSWRDETQHIIACISNALGGIEHIRDVHKELYELVEQRAGCNLTRRLTNMTQRMAAEGVSKSRRDKLNRLDVIAADRKLTEIYIAIVKDLAIKNGVSLSDTTKNEAHT